MMLSERFFLRRSEARALRADLMAKYVLTKTQTAMPSRRMQLILGDDVLLFVGSLV